MVSWWSLKEGIFGTSNPIAFSLCDRPREVLTDKPSGICKKHAWQVGMGAVQAPRPPGSPSNWFTKAVSGFGKLADLKGEIHDLGLSAAGRAKLLTLVTS